MGKLGKKARKFAKKKLPAVLKRQRKQKAFFKKRNSSSRDETNKPKDKAGDTTTTGREPIIEDVPLDLYSSEEEQNMVEIDSDIDGFLSEDPCAYAGGSETVLDSKDADKDSELSTPNQKIQSELLEKKEKLDNLKKKDPKFVTFLQDHMNDLESHRNEMMSDDEEMSEVDLQSDNVVSGTNICRTLKSSTISSWCQMVKEQHNLSVLPSLLNAYRAACHYGVDSITAGNSSPKIQNNETFCSIILFMLSEGDQLLRDLLAISPNCKKETILKLKISSNWEKVKPTVKSYLNSTLFLLNQLTEADIMAYTLTRLRASLIFFAVSPSLQRKLTKVAVNLWATGGGTLSSCSFCVLHDIAYIFGRDSYYKCLKKTYKAILSRCKVVDPASLKHVEYLRDSFVKLCSIDLEKSVEVAVSSTQKLAAVLQLGLQSKKEEALKKICSWEYVLGIDIWVMFVSAHIKDNDLGAILSTITNVIFGMSKIFAGPRYIPLRIKCLQWLNHLSSSSDIFIPISSLALDILESSNAEEDKKPIKGSFGLSTTLKLPKYWLKSREFQENCVFATVELLCAHFLQWSHHISFPELATIPIIRLRKFHDNSTIESLRRTVKRLIDQAENNSDFVQRKRDDVSFSPKDQDSANSFLQIEKRSDNAPFMQYYKSIIQNAKTRRPNTDDQRILPQEKKAQRKRKLQQKTGDAKANGDLKSGKSDADKSTKSRPKVKRKKQKT